MTELGLEEMAEHEGGRENRDEDSDESESGLDKLDSDSEVMVPPFGLTLRSTLQALSATLMDTSACISLNVSCISHFFFLEYFTLTR